MGDEWDSYFTPLNGEPASIFVNLGLAGEAPVGALTHVASVRIRMANPRQDGLSSSDEAPVLWRLEDALEFDVTSSEPPGVFAGRSTGGGSRELFFYLPSADGWSSRIRSVMASFPDYEFATEVHEDRSWAKYFEFLLPNDEQRQTIGNRKVCERLEGLGDALDQPREIDHWIYFPHPQQRQEFLVRSAAMGFLTRALHERSDTDERCGAQVYRVDVPSYNAIDEITLPFFRLARELGGEYDGWETMAVKAG